MAFPYSEAGTSLAEHDDAIDVEYTVVEEPKELGEPKMLEESHDTQP